MYINSTNIPPIIIMNRIYENQILLYIVPLITHTIAGCINSISSMAIGCFICVNFKQRYKIRHSHSNDKIRQQQHVSALAGPSPGKVQLD